MDKSIKWFKKWPERKVKLTNCALFFNDAHVLIFLHFAQIRIDPVNNSTFNMFNDLVAADILHI